MKLVFCLNSMEPSRVRLFTHHRNLLCEAQIQDSPRRGVPPPKNCLMFFKTPWNLRESGLGDVYISQWVNNLNVEARLIISFLKIHKKQKLCCAEIVHTFVELNFVQVLRNPVGSIIAIWRCLHFKPSDYFFKYLIQVITSNHRKTGVNIVALMNRF